MIDPSDIFLGKRVGVMLADIVIEFEQKDLIF